MTLTMLGLLGGLLVRRRRKLNRIVIDVDATASARLFLERAICFVDGDSVKPREEHRTMLKAVNPPPRSEQRLLRDVLCLCAIFDQPQHHHVDVIGMEAR